MMKVLRFITLAVIALFIFTPSPTTLAVGNVNDFTIQDYQIDYYLASDSENRSTLKTTETITAVFPDIDQNRGIERFIPDSYDGHTVDLQIESVTNKQGGAWPYMIRSENGNTIVRIGEANTYVRGEQVFTITYTQRDVTKYFEDTKSDEFYWDTNGIGWQVPIDALSVRLHVDPKLSANITNLPKCYRGAVGSTANCEVTKTEDGFLVTAGQLAARENITLAVAFSPQTFTPYVQSDLEKLIAVVLALVALSFLLTIPVAAILLVIFIVRYSRQSNRNKDRRSVIPEYLPPANTSVSVSAAILNHNSKAFTAQLIDLAVRNYLKIYQTAEKSWLKSASYELEITQDIQGLKSEEQEIINDIFNNPFVGARLNMESLKRNPLVGLKLSDNGSKVSKGVSEQYNLRLRNDAQSAWFKRAGWITLVVAVLSLSPWLLVASIAAFVSSYKLKPLTDQGLALYQYLQGLKMYIKVAEADRLRMLQSPDGAQKIGASADPNDPRQLIKLYELVLPYAILFGLEKDWNTQIGQYYVSVNEQPSWFVGSNGTFNALAFGAAISSFNSVSSYGSSSSSSSGGSSGGGFSGGGGGGGGGGGW